MTSKKQYKIIQDVTDFDNPSGAYVVVDTINEKIIAEFDFKLEAVEFIKQLKTNNQ
jgi:hypothetical protein